MRTNVVITTLLLLFFGGFTGFAQSFTGEKTQWHGFDRYDFVMNETSLMKMDVLAENDVPILNICGSIDPILKHWDIVYDYLAGKGFSRKSVLAGRGGATGEVYTWGIENPNKVACIYGENPIMRSSLAEVQPIDNLKPLAAAKVPLIHACGSLDPNLKTQTNEVKKRYAGKMTVILDPGRGHYPLEPNDPAKIAGLIIQTINE
jgi:hypothetical protein